MDGHTVQKIFSRPGVIVHSKNVQERRFPGTGRSHDGNEIALLDFEIDVAKNVKEFAFRERINALDVFQPDKWVDHNELFVRESFHWIQGRGATGGNKTGRGGNNGE